MTDNTVDSQRAYAIAISALEKLVEERGVEYAFPFDAIWEYAEETVPSSLRPGQAKRLERAGYLEMTGRMTKAVTEARAGSPTREYRPGSRFRSEEAIPSSSNISQSVPVTLHAMERAMAARGFNVTPAQLANFYLALQTTPLVILTGTSGTGKSRLPRLFAEIIGASDSFRLISVQPQWADNADLFGYTSSLAGNRFIEGKFTTAIRDARDTPDKPAIVLLDEMNLAAVEHYFSDFLSVIETRRKEDARTITDPLPLDLPSPDSVDPYQSLRGLWLPSNIRIVGTANMDETTRPFSPKVLDRAFSIEFDDVDLTAFVHHESSEQIEPDQFRLLADRLVDSTNPVSVSEVYIESQSFFDRIAGMLEEIRRLLQPAGINFGYRTRDAICLYLWHWSYDKMDNIMPLSTAFDFCVLQKILPKISGTGEALRQGLESLLEWLEQKEEDPEDAVLDSDDASLVVADNVTGSEPARPCPQSADRVRRMLRQLADEGATTYWST